MIFGEDRLRPGVANAVHISLDEIDAIRGVLIYILLINGDFTSPLETFSNGLKRLGVSFKFENPKLFGRMDKPLEFPQYSATI